ncbi:unnamed protein product [Bursaphelenchus okinawaensis]|uniref:C2H2-type domain-containing protein n=1 Tax=Bursaphelenchus okinawaensis TaxID=465554 RepID=A0A811JQA9_9BILA|nr:unnamed protein product [Bursaphelenchus okinawaensis]CAG9077910.1 unnamed protein product [Bursaphelenchus okinawaensis]
MENYTNGASAAPPENLRNYAFMMNYGYNPWMGSWLHSTVQTQYDPAAIEQHENNIVANNSVASSLSSNSSTVLLENPAASQNSPPLIKPPIDLSNLSLNSGTPSSLYNNYLNPEINSLFNQTINQVPLLASALPIEAAPSTSAPSRMIQTRTRTAPPSRPSTARACECPNCRTLQRQGNPNIKNEKHNCHIPGCHKVYARSSHLKAHLRWHTSSRPPVRRMANEKY